MEHDEDNSERCEHGLFWEFDCEMCEKESDEFFIELFTELGAGDPQLGRRIVLGMLRKGKRES